VCRNYLSGTSIMDVQLPQYVVQVIRNLCYMFRSDGTEYDSVFLSDNIFTIKNQLSKLLASDSDVEIFRSELVKYGFSTTEIDTIIRKTVAAIRDICATSASFEFVSRIVRNLAMLNDFRPNTSPANATCSLRSIAEDFSSVSVNHRPLCARVFRK